jgi:hypothetical protein
MHQQPVAIDKATPIWMGLDPGTRHPQGALWVALKGGTLYAVHEEWHPDNDIDQWVARFKAAEKPLPPVKWRVADPNSIHVRDRGSMQSLHAQYRRRGFLFQNGPSKHADRIPMLGHLVKNRRFKATKATPIFFDQMQAYRWEDLTATMRTKLGTHAEEYGPEKPVKVFDDLVDPAQYLSSRLVSIPKKDPLAGHKMDTLWEQQSKELRAALKKQTRSPKRTPSAAGTIV